MTPPAGTGDPLTQFAFAVEIDGILNAFFTECSGLGGQIEVFEYKEGGQNEFTHKLPGRVTYSNIQLKRGITDATSMYDWFHRVATAADKSSEMKTVTITHHAADGSVVLTWSLANAYPVKWTGPRFNAGSSSVAVEEFELAFGELTMTAGS
jgi:phage tail-like protein